MKDTVYIFCY